MVDRSEPSVTDRWKKGLAVLRERGPARWGLVGILAVVQVFVLFSAVMWWVGSSTASATANVAPQMWTGIVYDVGAAGVNLRSDPQVRPDDARDTAARGSRLALKCGETGDVVAKGSVSTATWLQTSDGLWVSMLYVRVPEHQSIPSCNGSKVDGPLLALADPANPQLPPPPNTQLGDQAASGSLSSRAQETAHDHANTGGGSTPGAPLALPPSPSAPVASGGSAKPMIQTLPTVGTGTATPTTTAPAPTEIGSAASPAHHQAHPTTPNPDTTPVG